MTQTTARAQRTAQPAPADDHAVAHYGSWRTRRLLAEGSMARVYEAAPCDAAAGSEALYAVKVLRREWEDDPCAVELARREVLAGRAVTSPHVVSILDWGLESPPYYVVMPKLMGTTLRALLDAEPRPALPTVLWIARQAAEALEALNEASWMHSDVKPSNLYISPEGHVTLLDLGYARQTGEVRSAAARLVVGTLSYMAPEALTSALAADCRSDIYSLGVTLYEMLTGKLPYEGRNPAEIAELQRAGVPDRLRCLAPTLPPGVVGLVRQMLAKEPLRRPQTPRELVKRLVALEIETFAERGVA